MKRIAEHERHYEPVEEMDIPWIRLVNVGEKIQINVSGTNSYLHCEFSNYMDLSENSGLFAVSNRLLLDEHPQQASIHILCPREYCYLLRFLRAF
jgi:hypothetical protein